MLFEALAGEAPFKSELLATVCVMHMNTQPPHLVMKDIDPIVVQRLDAIIQKCLAKEPSTRYQNIEDLQSDLELVQFRFNQLKSEKANKILLAIEKAWLFLSIFIRKANANLFSLRLSSSGLTVGAVAVIAFTVLALITIPGMIFLFGPSLNADVSERELPFKPIVDTSIRTTDQKLAETIWAKLQSSSVARWTPFLESALEVFLRVADSTKQAGNYEIARWWYYRSELVLDWLKIDKSMLAIHVYNSYAESCLLANTALDTPDQVQNERLKALKKQLGKFINPQIFRDNSLIYAANAATARDAALGALGRIGALTLIERSNKSLAQELLGQGLLAESFRELDDTEEAKTNYDKFYSMLSKNNSSTELNKSQLTYLLSSAGRFLLQQKELSKAAELLSRLQSALTEFGNPAEYELAVIYNDLGLIKEAENKNNEAELFFNQSYGFLTASSQCNEKYKSLVLNNIAIASVKAGDYRSAMRAKLKTLAKLSI